MNMNDYIKKFYKNITFNGSTNYEAAFNLAFKTFEAF